MRKLFAQIKSWALLKEKTKKDEMQEVGFRGSTLNSTAINALGDNGTHGLPDKPSNSFQADEDGEASYTNFFFSVRPSFFRKVLLSVS